MEFPAHSPALTQKTAIFAKAEGGEAGQARLMRIQ
jgi:hypothetical protein